MRGRRLELPCPCGRYHLKVVRLPFRHPRLICELTIVDYWGIVKGYFLCYLRPTNKGRLAQLVRATRLHRVGRGFESPSVHHETPTTRRSFFVAV